MTRKPDSSRRPDNSRKPTKIVAVKPPNGRNTLAGGILYDPWLVLIALLLAFGVYIALAFLFMPRQSAPSTELFIPELQKLVRPKPGENFLYVFGLCCTLTLPIFCYWILKRLSERFKACFSWLETSDAGSLHDLLVATGCLVWLYYLAVNSKLHNITLLLPFSLLAAVLLVWVMLQKPRLPRFVVHGFAGLLLVLSAALQAVGETLSLSRVDLCYHFDFMLGAINNVAHGRTILVDATSFYGIFYPYIAYWVIAPFGVTVDHVMYFFVGVVLAAMFFLYLAITRKTGAGSPSSLLLLAAVIGILHPFYVAASFNFESSYVYYQYFPLRMACGAFFLWFVSVYFAHKSRRLAALGYAMAGFSVLWNNDTGLVVLIAWSMTLAFDAVASAAGNFRKICTGAVVHCALGVLTLLLSLGFYSAFAWLRSGKWPSPESFFFFQSLYCKTGFGLLPMDVAEFWQPLILVYVLTIFHCMRKLLAKQVDANAKWYFFIALYGLGIFSYYEGRCEIHSLANIAYPAVMLSGFWAVDFASQCGRADWRRFFSDFNYRHAILTIALCLILPAFGAINFFRFLPEAAAFSVGKFTPPSPAAPSDYDPAFPSLEKYLGGRRTIVFSQISGFVYMRTHGFSALPVSSPWEIFLNSQVEAIQALLDNDRELKYIAVDKRTHRIMAEYLSHLRFDRFRAVEETANFVVLKRVGVGEIRQSK